MNSHKDSSSSSSAVVEPLKLIEILKELVSEKTNTDTNKNNEKVWSIGCSEYAKHTFNPIRRLVQSLDIKPNPEKPVISLSVGDPTILSDLEKPECLKEIVNEALKNKHNDGYTPSFGTDKARQAIANYYSRPPNINYKLQV